MSRILIIHTPSQLEEASSLVDLLEASLSLPEGALVCSSLPGYAFSQRVTGAHEPGEWRQRLDGIGAALALVDCQAVTDAQLWFDVASVWARGKKRVAVLLDGEERRPQLPPQLADAQVLLRADRSALIALIEDLAFDLGLAPRIGKDAQRALDQFSTFPPPDARLSPASSHDNDVPTVRPRKPEPDEDSYEALDTVPPPARVPNEAIGVSDFEATSGFESTEDDEPLELDEDDVEPVNFGHELHASYHSGVESRLTCEAALEAGRAIGECSFHRDEGVDFSAELDAPFGSFVDAVGGNWAELRQLCDVELWLGATDNLLEALPAARREAGEWYELGFQFSTLRSIAEQGLPVELEPRAVYQELWNQSMAQFRNSAASARIVPRDIRRLQALLENLLGAEVKRDYANIARALAELRALASLSDRGALQVGATG